MFGRSLFIINHSFCVLINLEAKLSLVFHVVLHVKLLALPNLLVAAVIESQIFSNAFDLHLSFETGEINHLNVTWVIALLALLPVLVHGLWPTLNENWCQVLVTNVAQNFSQSDLSFMFLQTLWANQVVQIAVDEWSDFFLFPV